MSTSLEEADRSPKQLPPGFYGVGDDAFVCQQQYAFDPLVWCVVDGVPRLV
jgi:hypothetical protein